MCYSSVWYIRYDYDSLWSICDIVSYQSVTVLSDQSLSNSLWSVSYNSFLSVSRNSLGQFVTILFGIVIGPCLLSASCGSLWSVLFNSLVSGQYYLATTTWQANLL